MPARLRGAMWVVAGLALAGVAAGCGDGGGEASPPTPEPDTMPRVMRVQADGAVLHVEVQGSGPAVVVLHGWAARWLPEQWHDLLAALIPGRTVIGMDIRGHGRSDKPHDPSDYGLTLTDDVVRVLDTLGLARADLIGYSMGGIIALRTAASHPDRIGATVLIGEGLTSAEELRGMAQAGRDLLQVDTTELSGDELEGFRRNDVQALAALAQAYPALALSDDEAAGLGPMLAVVGSEDPRLARAQALKALDPELEIQIVQGRDHGTVVQGPAYAEAIRRYLNRMSPIGGATGGG